MTDPLSLTPTLAPDYLDRDEIASRAYDLWQSRGCPQGTAEQDWLEAEHQLRRERVARLEATQLFTPPTADGIDSPFQAAVLPVASLADTAGTTPKRRRRPSASAVSNAVAAATDSGAGAAASTPPTASARVARKRPARPDA